MYKFRFHEPESLLPGCPKPFKIQDQELRDLPLTENIEDLEDNKNQDLDVQDEDQDLDVQGPIRPQSKKMTKRITKNFSPLHSDDLERFTVKALRAHCVDKNLDSKGTRAVIIKRLCKHYNI